VGPVDVEDLISRCCFDD